MVDKTIFEIGDNLESLANKAKDWFGTNNVTCPINASNWQKASVRKGEIPPGTGVGSLRRYGFNVTTFVSLITGNTKLKAYIVAPINQYNIEELLGLSWVSSKEVKQHKKVLTRCVSCAQEEELDYGTLQRMVKAGNKLCRYCRNAGGKQKILETYNTFDGFAIESRTTDKRYTYKCDKCSNTIERTNTHVNTSEYLVCEYCHPRENFGARHYTELGYFDSKIEYEAYKILLKYLSPELVVRQKKYSELFGTGTNHTADFYIPIADLVLEVTSKYNKIGQKYKDTAAWKLSLSNKVKFAYSLSEVEDIVRPIAKALGLTVEHSGDVLCCCFKWR